MNEGEGTSSKDVGKPRAMVDRRCPRDLGQGGKGFVVVGGKKQLITAGGSQILQNSGASNLLKEDQVGVVLLEEGRETSQIASTAGVERQKREERARLLPIVPISRRHRGKRQKCAETQEK